MISAESEVVSVIFLLDEVEELERRASDDEGEEENTEAEEKRRLERLEREKWLEEEAAKANSKKDEEESDSQFFDRANRTIKRMNSKQDSMPILPSETTKKSFKSPSSKMPLQSLVSD